jgi:hypothetical protein
MGVGHDPSLFPASTRTAHPNILHQERLYTGAEIGVDIRTTHSVRGALSNFREENVISLLQYPGRRIAGSDYCPDVSLTRYVFQQPTVSGMSVPKREESNATSI